MMTIKIANDNNQNTSNNLADQPFTNTQFNNIAPNNAIEKDTSNIDPDSPVPDNIPPNNVTEQNIVNTELDSLVPDNVTEQNIVNTELDSLVPDNIALNNAIEKDTSNTDPDSLASDNIALNNVLEENIINTDADSLAPNDVTKENTGNTQSNNPVSKKNNKNTNNKTNPEKLRKLVMVTGDKGGVGKSTFARGLAQTYIDNAVKFVGLDADNSNPHLIRFYEKAANIQRLDISNSDKLDEFVDNLKELVYPKSKESGKYRDSQSLILLETPSQFLPTLKILITEMGFLDVVNNKCKMQVTIVIVISTIIDCITQLLELYSFCGDRVDYVIVKNLFYGETEQFTFYNSSEEIKVIEQQVKATGHDFTSINMPKLAKKSYDFLDVKNLTFRQGLEQDEYPSVFGRVLSWLNNFKGQIKPKKDLFGIEKILSE
jgi:CobQ/CobB/MinD/ParA nucleotide binding domain